MPRTTRKPNAQLKTIVLEETNDGRDVVRYLKSVFMEVADAPRLFGLIPDDYARTHKIAASRILARLGLEEGKRYLRRNYVQTPFKRVHPEDEDGPKKDMAASTADLYRLVKKQTNDGRDIMTYFVGIMKGYHPEYKPHLRMAAARELVRQIEFDYDEPIAPAPATGPTPSNTRAEPAEVAAASPANPVYPENPVNPASDNAPDADLPDQTNPVYPASDNAPDADLPNQANPINPDSDNILNNLPKFVPNPYREYTDRNCAEEAESIYQSIIRRASDRPDLDSAKLDAEQLIDDFNQFVSDRDPDSNPSPCRTIFSPSRSPFRCRIPNPTYSIRPNTTTSTGTTSTSASVDVVRSATSSTTSSSSCANWKKTPPLSTKTLDPAGRKTEYSRPPAEVHLNLYQISLRRLWFENPPPSGLTRVGKNPFPLDGLTGAGKIVVSYEFQATDPLSLRERVGVRVNAYPYQPLTGEG